MTDKEQIIINGVDVRECEYLTNQLEEDGEYYWFCKMSPTGGPDECEYNPNCHFKQLQKEKFENLNNKQMVENAENLIYENSKLYKNLKEKEQECEKLKEKFKKFFNIDNQECWDIAFLKDENEHYRKALDEIEEIAKGMRSIFIEEISITASQLNDRIYQESTARFRQILDIINKARGE